MRLLFMGTPEFAVTTLEMLHAHGHQIAAVVTAPDKPQGRGLKPEPSAVKVCAAQLGLPVYQPVSLKEPETAETLRAFQADVFIVVAFRMLPEVIWSIPPLGSYNLHASLLPQYRGAAPINWAIINGESMTGVTTFRIQQEIDTGNIVFQEREPILPDDTAGTLYERLRQKGARLVCDTVDAIAAGNQPNIPQPPQGESLKPAPKIFRETCRINWALPSEDVVNFIRGLSPFPGAWTTLDGKTFKIHFAKNGRTSVNDSPGQIIRSDGEILEVACATGSVTCTEVQPEGKRKMSAVEFLRGHRFIQTRFE